MGGAGPTGRPALMSAETKGAGTAALDISFLDDRLTFNAPHTKLVPPAGWWKLKIKEASPR